jgi:4-hydroxybenzoate polyprenyltransferase
MDFLEGIKIFRIKDWLHYLGFTVLGIVFGGLLANIVFILLLLSALMLAYAYSLNVAYDKKLKTRLYLIPLVTSLALFVFLNPMQMLFSVIFLFIVTVYSIPKPHLKSKPVICTLCNAIAFPCLFALGFFGAGSSMSLFIYFYTVLFLLSVVIQLIHELSDLEEDKRDKIITTAARFGERITGSVIWLCLIITALISVASVLTIPTLFLLLPFSIYFIIRTKVNDWSRIRLEFRYIGTVLGGLVALFEILV